MELEIRPGVGPVIASPRARRRPTCACCASSSPTLDAPWLAEAAAWLHGRARCPADRLRRRAVHARQLSRRGRPSKAQARTKALMLSDAAHVARAARALCDIALASAAAQVLPGPAPIQVFDSWIGSLVGRRSTSDTCCPSCAGCSTASPSLGVPRVYFGVGTGHLLELIARAGPDVIGVDWRVPLELARARIPGDDRAPGQSRSRSSAWRPGVRAMPRRFTARARAPTRGYVFNLGHGVLPATAPEAIKRLVELVACSSRAEDVERNGVGAPDAGGSRWPTARRLAPPRDRGILHAHPPRTAAQPLSCSPSCRPATRRSAAARRLLAIARAQAARARAPSSACDVELGYKHAAPFIEEALARLVEAGVRRIVGVVLAPHYSSMSVGEYARRGARRRAARERSARRQRRSRLAPGARLPRAARRALSSTRSVRSFRRPLRRRARAVHRAQPAGADPRQQATRIPSSCARRPRRSPSSPASSAGASRGRARGAPSEPWIGPDVLEVLGELAGDGVPAVVVCRRRLRRRPPRGPLRPRHRGARTRRVARPRVRAHRVAERRAGADRGAVAGAVRGALAERVVVSRPAHVVIVGGGITGLAAAHRLTRLSSARPCRSRCSRPASASAARSAPRQFAGQALDVRRRGDARARSRRPSRCAASSGWPTSSSRPRPISRFSGRAARCARCRRACSPALPDGTGAVAATGILSPPGCCAPASICLLPSRPLASRRVDRVARPPPARARGARAADRAAARRHPRRRAPMRSACARRSAARWRARARHGLVRGLRAAARAAPAPGRADVPRARAAGSRR